MHYLLRSIKQIKCQITFTPLPSAQQMTHSCATTALSSQLSRRARRSASALESGVPSPEPVPPIKMGEISLVSCARPGEQVTRRRDLRGGVGVGVRRIVWVVCDSRLACSGMEGNVVSASSGGVRVRRGAEWERGRMGDEAVAGERERWGPRGGAR